MNITQLSEQLKDVPQGTLIGYAKNPNSVVPQFLALAEIQRRQQLQAPASAPTGTVADDVLAQAAPQPMAPQQMPQMPPQQVDPRMLQAMQQAQQLPENQPGVTQLPSGMPQGMASGGIVAFANGGEADDEDYQDYLDKRETAKRRSGVDEIYAMLKDRVAGVSDSFTSGVKDAASGMREATAGIRNILPQSYEQAKKETQPSTKTDDNHVEGFLSKLEHLESRGKHFDEKGKILTSKKGAEGIMQVMPKTQVDPGYGVTPARDKSPEELKRVGRDYGIAMLNEFKDPQIAAMAYNWGPNNVKKWLASDKTLPIPKETLKYRSHFAQGGITKLAVGGSVPRFYEGQQISLEDYYAGQDAADMANVLPSVKPQTMSMDDYYAGQDMADFEGYSRNPLLATTPTPPVNEYDEMLREQRAAIEENKSGRKQDAYLALMQAGFGMMGGSSPYAFQNIGQGAAAGVNAYANLSKQRGAELNALRKIQSGALEGKQLYEAKKIAQEQLNEYKKDALDRTTEAKKNALESLDYTRKERIRQNQEKIDNAAEAAKDAKEAKERGLLESARKNANNDDNYQNASKIIKELEAMNPADPRIAHQRAIQEAIMQAAVKSSLTGTYVPPTFPVYIPPEKKSNKGVLQSLKDMFPTSVPSPSLKPPSSGTLRFDKDGNLIQ
jgi:hypothetical protein